MKNKITSSLPFLQATRVQLKNVAKIAVITNKVGVGSTGTRQFKYDYFPTISYHNKNIKTQAFVKKFANTKPMVSIEYSKL